MTMIGLKLDVFCAPDDGIQDFSASRRMPIILVPELVQKCSGRVFGPHSQSEH
jgi:hypothetical protein